MNRRRVILSDIGIERWVPRDRDEPALGEPPAREPEAARTVVAAEFPDWELLQQQVAACERCDLAGSRQHVVFGSGDPRADLLLIGEAPGAEEDRRGEPFVGRAGKLLDAMLLAIGLQRDAVFICNVLKCRPPNNRDPRPEQVEACAPWLDAQLAHVRPRVILALGRFAAHRILRTDAPVWRMRESENSLPDSDIPVVVTYHPASLLRNPENKAKAWRDLCKVRDLLDGPGASPPGSPDSAAG